jgi:exopolyphosphatase/guanosine-5'-triphosphate,3'-diphosphate pyrophosphatase
MVRHRCRDNAAMITRDCDRLPDVDARWPGQLAAIDMGSNSFRLEIGQLQPGPLPAHRLPEGNRAPGAGLDGDGL